MSTHAARTADEADVSHAKEGSPPLVVVVFEPGRPRDDGRPRAEQHVLALGKHLAPIVARAELRLWSVRDVEHGRRVDIELERHLARAHVVVILITAQLLASFKAMRSVEAVLRRVARAELILVPVLVEPCLHDESILAERKLIPRSGLAITASADPEAEWVEVARSVIEAARQARSEMTVGEPTVDERGQPDSDRRASSTGPPPGGSPRDPETTPDIDRGTGEPSVESNKGSSASKAARRWAPWIAAGLGGAGAITLALKACLLPPQNPQRHYQRATELRTDGEHDLSQVAALRALAAGEPRALSMALPAVVRTRGRTMSRYAGLPPEPVATLAVRADGSMIAAASKSGRLMVWRRRDAEVLLQEQLPFGEPDEMAFVEEEPISVVITSSARPATVARRFVGPPTVKSDFVLPASCSHATLSADGGRVACVAGEGGVAEIAVYDTRTHRPLPPARAPGVAHVVGLALSPRGDSVLVVDGSPPERPLGFTLFDTAGGEARAHRKTGIDGADYVYLSTGAERAVIAGDKVSTWELSGSWGGAVPDLPDRGLTCLAVTEDASRIFAGFSSHALFEIVAGEAPIVRAPPLRLPHPPTALAVHDRREAGGDTLVVGDVTGVVRAYALTSEAGVRSTVNLGLLDAAALVPSGEAVLVCRPHEDGTFQVRRHSADGSVEVLGGFPSAGGCLALAVSADGNSAAISRSTGPGSAVVDVVPLGPGGHTLRSWSSPSLGQPRLLAFSHDSASLAVASGAQVQKIALDSGTVTTLSPPAGAGDGEVTGLLDGSKGLLGMSSSGALWRWNRWRSPADSIFAGEISDKLEPQSANLGESADGNVIFAATRGRNASGLRMWTRLAAPEPPKKESLATFVYGVAVRAGGDLAAVATGDEIVVWDVALGEPIASFEESGSDAKALAFEGGGQLASITQQADATWRWTRWNLEPILRGRGELLANPALVLRQRFPRAASVVDP